MFLKEFYKMKLIPDERGLSVWTDTYLSIYETPCYHYCIHSRNKGFFNSVHMNDGETPLQFAKRKKLTIKKIHKENSRFAFNTQELAFKHLRKMKKRQIDHLKRELAFIQTFLQKTTENGFYKLQNYHLTWQQNCGVPAKIVEGTEELVKEHFVFE